MEKRFLCILIGMAMVVSLLGCNAAAPATEEIVAPAADATTAPVAKATPDSAAVDASPSSTSEFVIINGEQYLRDGWGVNEPEPDVDIETVTLSDFGDLFAEAYETEKSSYKLMEGTEQEMEVVVLQGAEEGPVLYIVSGIHGDERAGWYTGTLLKDITIKSGTLYIIAPVNTYGAREHVRFISAENIDLNRNFPGDPEGNTAEKVAAALMADIEEKQPEMVFDLHEARSTGERGDFLGSSLIYTTLDGISDMFMDMLFATQIGDLCSEAFSYNSPGPNGSINSTVANTLGIPVITVETFRGYELSRRMGDQLAIIEYVLESYGIR